MRTSKEEAQEALFEADIDPIRRAETLSLSGRFAMLANAVAASAVALKRISIL